MSKRSGARACAARMRRSGWAALAVAAAVGIGAGIATGGATGRAAAQEAADPAIQIDRSDVTADSLISRHQAAPRDPNRGPVTNLPLPRYVSLKGGEGNARRGPSLSHRIDWVFRHPGMPLLVVAEFGHWRRVEDQDGAGGWVHYSLLSGVRTAIITTDMAELRSRADPNASVLARAEAGAIVRLHECSPDWCRVSGGGEKGWVVKTSLWGVDPGEIRD
ncbi:SH3 domain-containing protein [Paracoccus alkenifer]|uniref:SH3-like domain-containing protein n=1 Tax=Paracoccus alkenifer TaxID=65735 RepID=A0A1H6K5E2_9RHOB|nr:SH3-like domain-containing protein [Paracoccus alkenifer]